ncbi:MAG: rod shape-determining protein MreC, partial [Desulfobacterales bacterium]
MLSKRTVIFIVVIALIAVNIILISVASQPNRPTYGPGRIAIPLVSPLQKGVSRSIRFAGDIWRHYFHLVFVSQENDRIKTALSRALEEKHALEEVALSNIRLRNLLNFQEKLTYPVLSAEIIGKDPSPYFRTVTIDKGRSDGVKKGLPVVVSEGVAGLVIDASSHSSKVMLIVDKNSAVDALIQKTRARGIVKGGSEDQCSLQYVLRKHEVSIGDTVVTSGLDGAFPKGLRIGYVSGVIKRTTEISQEITVTPYVDIEGLEEVLVLLNPSQA